MESMNSTKTYVHKDMGKTVTAIGGHYTMDEERCLPFDGYKVLYLVGHAVVDTSCCGTGGCRYVLVQGVIVDWKGWQDRHGFPVSQVKSVSDPLLRKKISEEIQYKEKVHQVIFT
jgi:hypothetical protein